MRLTEDCEMTSDFETLCLTPSFEMLRLMRGLGSTRQMQHFKIFRYTRYPSEILHLTPDFKMCLAHSFEILRLTQGFGSTHQTQGSETFHLTPDFKMLCLTRDFKTFHQTDNFGFFRLTPCFEITCQTQHFEIMLTIVAIKTLSKLI